MSLEWINQNVESSENFRPWYEKLGKELYTLGKTLKEQSPSREALSMLNPHLIDKDQLGNTKEFLEQYIDDIEVWDLVISLREKIDSIINLNITQDNLLKVEYNNSANNTGYYPKNLKTV